MSEQPRSIEEQLRTCLQDQYDLIPATVDFLPLGLDYTAGVYRVVSKCGTPYLAKVKSGVIYEPGYFIPSYLHNQGITSVVAPLATKNNSLWVQLENRTVVVYPFIDGDSSWTGMTDEHWKRVGNTFSKVHQVALPPLGFDLLRKETFNTTEYVGWIRNFESQHIQAQIGESDSERELRSAWITHQSVINKAIDSLEKLASVLQKRTFSFVICHADLHPANVLRESTGNVFIVDWDEVMMAPKERDFIFLNEESFYGLSGDSITPFIQGYGTTEIDWNVLTYYKFERAIQDLIAYTEEALFKDDSAGEKTKANALQAFNELLEDGGEISAAYSAAKHLQPDFISLINNK
jgi:spectinomycin phosphotransferase